MKKNEIFANHLEREIQKMSLWYSGLRESGYRCLIYIAQSLGDSFYSYPEIGRELRDSLFCEVDNLPKAAWRSLLNIVFKPLILSCPHLQYNQVLDFVVPQLLTILPEKLDLEWLANTNLQSE